MEGIDSSPPPISRNYGKVVSALLSITAVLSCASFLLLIFIGDDASCLIYISSYNSFKDFSSLLLCKSSFSVLFKLLGRKSKAAPKFIY
jgi:hypothetical protein